MHLERKGPHRLLILWKYLLGGILQIKSLSKQNKARGSLMKKIFFVLVMAYVHY
jgi:hypothetical protein